MDGGQIRDRDDRVGDRIERAQHIEVLSPTGRLDLAPNETPEVSEKRAEDKMRRLHKKDRTLTGACFLSRDSASRWQT
jgi:hypothetical protein